MQNYKEKGGIYTRSRLWFVISELGTEVRVSSAKNIRATSKIGALFLSQGSEKASVFYSDSLNGMLGSYTRFCIYDAFHI